MKKGAVEQVLETRNIRMRGAQAQARKAEAINLLRDLGVEMAVNCSATGFESFAVAVLENECLQNELRDAKRHDIRVIVNSEDMSVCNEIIYIRLDATITDVMRFLKGDRYAPGLPVRTRHGSEAGP